MAESRVLVTGATGFVAGHCINELLSKGYAVRATVRDRMTADVSHLQEIAARTGGSLEFVEASLEREDGWAAAVDGCEFVWHLASPVPSGVPKDENEIIRPAVEGTLCVLRAAAASATVVRVVIASSVDAIVRGHDDLDRVHTEEDWSASEGVAPYVKSKLLAERAAWDFSADAPLELVTINPGLVLGPLLHAGQNTSTDVVRMLLARKIPAVPPLGFAVVDARDVARAFRLATENPAARGNRYIVADAAMWMGDIAAILEAEFGPRGYKVPARRLPHWLMWLNARVDQSVRLGLTYYGQPVLVSADKARRELGWTPRPAAEAIIATGQTMLEHGVIPRNDKDPAPKNIAPTVQST